MISNTFSQKFGKICQIKVVDVHKRNHYLSLNKIIADIFEGLEKLKKSIQQIHQNGLASKIKYQI